MASIYPFPLLKKKSLIFISNDYFLFFLSRRNLFDERKIRRGWTRCDLRSGKSYPRHFKLILPLFHRLPFSFLFLTFQPNRNHLPASQLRFHRENTHLNRDSLIEVDANESGTFFTDRSCEFDKFEFGALFRECIVNPNRR